MRAGLICRQPSEPASGLPSSATTRSPRSDANVWPSISVVVVLPTPPLRLITAIERQPATRHLALRSAGARQLGGAGQWKRRKDHEVVADVQDLLSVVGGYDPVAQSWRRCGPASAAGAGSARAMDRMLDLHEDLVDKGDGLLEFAL